MSGIFIASIKMKNAFVDYVLENIIAGLLIFVAGFGIGYIVSILLKRKKKKNLNQWPKN